MPNSDGAPTGYIVAIVTFGALMLLAFVNVFSRLITWPKVCLSAGISLFFEEAFR
jgi:hypothetical protein